MCPYLNKWQHLALFETSLIWAIHVLAPRKTCTVWNEDDPRIESLPKGKILGRERGSQVQAS